jgi:5-methylcytosine-specific restriction endonuclease McrBC regulatory subunit McrC
MVSYLYNYKDHGGSKIYKIYPSNNRYNTKKLVQNAFEQNKTKIMVCSKSNRVRFNINNDNEQIRQV